MRIVIAGSSGFLGTHLVDRLSADGHDITRLVRRPAGGSGESTWDPYADSVDTGMIGDADVVINLAGAPTLGNPHSGKWARAVMESRVTTTDVLARAIAAAPRPPAFLAGNGISYYGDHGADPLDEAADSRGDALLTRVTRAWQAATTPAKEAGARVVVLRTAPVLDKSTAPLKQLHLLFKLGLGARLGDGSQHFPVVSLRDWVGAVTFLAGSDVAGPVNLCSPMTPTNAEFTQALADAVGRKALLVAPGFVLDKLAGAMGPELLGSVNARPVALQSAGYEFVDHDVRDVIATGLA